MYISILLGIAIIGVELSIALIIILVILIMKVFKEKQRRMRAAQALLDSVKKKQSEGLEKAKLLMQKLKIPTLEQEKFIKNLEEQENKYYANLIKTFLDTRLDNINNIRNGLSDIMQVYYNLSDHIPKETPKISPTVAILPDTVPVLADAVAQAPELTKIIEETVEPAAITPVSEPAVMSAAVDISVTADTTSEVKAVAETVATAVVEPQVVEKTEESSSHTEINTLLQEAINEVESETEAVASEVVAADLNRPEFDANMVESYRNKFMEYLKNKNMPRPDLQATQETAKAREPSEVSE